MPTFRQRPVTWLFFIASAVLAAAIAPIAAVIFVGACFILGAYLVCGQSHRLLRGSAFVVGSVVLAVGVSLTAGSPGQFGQVFAGITLLQIYAALGAFVVRSGCRLFVRCRSKDRSFRYPIVELMGWTIVVAIGSAAARNAPFAELLLRSDMAIWCGSAFVSGICVGAAMQLFVHRATHTAGSLAAAIALVAVFSIGLIGAWIATLAGSHLDRSLLGAPLGYALAFAISQIVDRPLPATSADPTTYVGDELLEAISPFD